MEAGFVKKLRSRRTIINSTVMEQEGLIELDNNTRERLQALLLSMYQDICSVCEKYGLIPYLTGGSALGAVRHHGFIPWDDDLDIGMTREDYQVFRRIFQKELGGKYRLNAPNYSRSPKARFPKVMKKGTLCREMGDHSDPENCGVFVDIFIIENIPDNKVQRFLKGVCCNSLEFIAGQVALMELDNRKSMAGINNEGKTVAAIRMFTGMIFGIVPSGNWYHGIDKLVRSPKSSALAGLPTGRRHYFGETLPKEVFFPPRYIDFCGMKAPVFHKVEEYLSNLFGDDYMELPPVEKRERHLYTELEF